MFRYDQSSRLRTDKLNPSKKTHHSLRHLIEQRGYLAHEQQYSYLVVHRTPVVVAWNEVLSSCSTSSEVVGETPRRTLYEAVERMFNRADNKRAHNKLFLKVIKLPRTHENSGAKVPPARTRHSRTGWDDIASSVLSPGEKCQNCNGSSLHRGLFRVSPVRYRRHKRAIDHVCD